MFTYIIVINNADSVSDILAVTDNLNKAEHLIEDLESEDKFIGLYQPNRYAIIRSESDD